MKVKLGSWSVFLVKVSGLFVENLCYGLSGLFLRILDVLLCEGLLSSVPAETMFGSVVKFYISCVTPNTDRKSELKSVLCGWRMVWELRLKRGLLVCDFLVFSAPDSQFPFIKKAKHGHFSESSVAW